MNGSSFEDNIEQLKIENAQLREAENGSGQGLRASADKRAADAGLDALAAVLLPRMQKILKEESKHVEG